MSCRRKKVGVLATEKWGPEFPKFNSPQMKAELNEFSAKIAPVCSIPEVGFNEEGIAKHIQDFCSEQRRYLKLKRSKVHLLPLLLLIFDYTVLWNDKGECQTFIDRLNCLL